uniref:Uncharacterized protein n=1 Tax=Sus scrofa TaxID=9823 RepID=A0A8D0UAX9_PIG
TRGECPFLFLVLPGCTYRPAPVRKGIRVAGQTPEGRPEHVLLVEAQQGLLVGRIMKSKATHSLEFLRLESRCHRLRAREMMLKSCACSGLKMTLHRSCSSDWTPSLGTSTCCRCSFKAPVQAFPGPLKGWGRGGGSQRKKKTLCQMLRRLLALGLAIISSSFCMRTKKDHIHFSVGLKAVDTMAQDTGLLSSYLIWDIVPVKYLCIQVTEWLAGQDVIMLAPKTTPNYSITSSVLGLHSWHINRKKTYL